MPLSSPLLQLTDLACARQQKVIFNNINVELHTGEALIVQGENGCGKSSLLRLLTGMVTLTNGDIYWQGQSIQTQLTEYTENLHYIGHANGIKLGLTVLENLILTARLHGQSGSINEDVLHLLKLNNHQHTFAKYLSAGQKRRLALAKLWLIPKSIWILDEPYTALDTDTQTLFLTKLNEHLQTGGVAILSTHHTISLSHPIKTLRLSAC